MNEKRMLNGLKEIRLISGVIAVLLAIGGMMAVGEDSSKLLRFFFASAIFLSCMVHMLVFAFIIGYERKTDEESTEKI